MATNTRGFVHYPLEPEGAGDWIGLCELTLLPDGSFAVIERDRGWGPTTGFNAKLKAIFGIDLAAAEFRAFDAPSGLVTIGKTLFRDLLPELKKASIWTAEKLEGLAVADDGQIYAVTDNDGVDGATGETIFSTWVTGKKLSTTRKREEGENEAERRRLKIQRKHEAEARRFPPPRAHFTPNTSRPFSFDIWSAANTLSSFLMISGRGRCSGPVEPIVPAACRIVTHKKQ